MYFQSYIKCVREELRNFYNERASNFKFWDHVLNNKATENIIEIAILLRGV